MRAPRQHPEDDLQFEIVKYLRAVLKPPTIFTHIPAGGGGEARGRRIKRLGYCAGFPDLMILDGGRAFFGECKAEKGRLTASQEETIPMIKRARCPVAIWRSIDDVAASLAEWGISTREAKHVLLEITSTSIPGGPEWHWPDSGPLVRRKGAK